MKMQRYSNDITAAELKLVESMTRKCLRVLSRKDVELCSDYRTAVKMLPRVIVKASGQSSYGGAQYISIDISCYRGGWKRMTEYAAYKSDPTIGDFEGETPEDALLCLVAHEVSHHVQYRWGPYCRWLRKKYRKPHGEGFQAIYRILRRELVNK